MVKILVVDDHAIVRRGVIRILEECPELGAVCDEAADAREAAQLVAAGGYAMVLLDISLPGVSGLELLKKMHRDNPKVPILILSMYPEEQYAIRALTLGAVGYLSKESAPDDLLAAARKVLAGGRYISAQLAERLAAHLGSGARDGTQPHEDLSDREFAVLRLIGAGRTPGQIAGELFLSAKTVSTYRSRILRKMELKSNAELMSYALRNSLAD
jgi:two-component system, NarL family, invasion response regulator UvrY